MIDPAARVTVRSGVVFGTGGGRDLQCDIYEPPSALRNGVGVLLLHGGGWRTGDRTQLRGYGVLLGRRGFTCVASEYRLVDEALWPAQIEDVKAAIRWMRAGATDLGIDPARIVVEGNSAGGHLALAAAGIPASAGYEGNGGNAGVPSGVAAAIAFYPPTGPDRRDWGGLPLLFGPGAPAEVLRGASPLSWVNQAFPPTLLLQGSNDDVVPASEATRMHEALESAGVPSELHLFARQPHGFDADPHLGRLCADLMVSFLNRFVPGP